LNAPLAISLLCFSYLCWPKGTSMFLYKYWNSLTSASEISAPVARRLLKTAMTSSVHHRGKASSVPWPCRTHI
jgi:hypothetical protein